MLPRPSQATRGSLSEGMLRLSLERLMRHWPVRVLWESFTELPVKPEGASYYGLAGYESP